MTLIQEKLISDFTFTPNAVISVPMNKYINKFLQLRSWVTINHHIPGRVRLKYKLGIVAHLAALRAKDIELTIASVPAFKNYKLNSATGSILIEYDADVINPKWIEAIFSRSKTDAEQACYLIAESLNLDGVENE